MPATSKTAGASKCEGRWTNMAMLDDLVVENVIEHTLQPERLAELLSAWLEQSTGAKLAIAPNGTGMARPT